jgi:flagellar basal-body rod protein FlgG
VVTSDGYPLEPGITIPSDTTSITIVTPDVRSPLSVREKPQPPRWAPFNCPSSSIPRSEKSGEKHVHQHPVINGGSIQGTPGLDGFGTISLGFRRCPMATLSKSCGK